jgi:hypothetical protein
MATTYVQILAVQRPFAFNVDENDRTMFSVNFEGLAGAPVAEWEEELVKILTDAGLATPNVDTFIGATKEAPAGNGPYTHVLDTGGSSPEETHDGSAYERLSAQIVVRAKDYDAARTRAHAIWRALDGLRNTTVTA